MKQAITQGSNFWRRGCFGLALLALAMQPLLLRAQGNEPPVTRTFVLTGATVIPAPGQKLENTRVVVKNGLITAVAADAAIPGEAKILAADSMFVYAGFISGLSWAGVPSKDEPQQQGRQRAPEGVIPGTPPDKLAGITPAQTVNEFLDPEDKAIGELRSVGFTAALTPPRGKMLPGQGSLILLAGNKPDQMPYRDHLAVYAQFVPAAGVYPATPLGLMATWKNLYHEATSGLEYEKRYKTSPADMERPMYPEKVKAFYPVVDKTQPVLFRTNDDKSAFRALALQQELGFRLMLAELSRGQAALGKIKAANVPVFLSLDLPEKPKADAKKPEINPNPEIQAENDSLLKRQEAALKQAWTQAADFAKAGVPFGFSTIELKPKSFQDNVALMIENGLTEAQLLTALTTEPARLFGVSDVMGTVEKGKMANLVVMDKPLSDPKAKVKMVIVDGQVFEISTKKAGKADAGVKVSGKWDYTVESPQGSNGGVLQLKGADGDYSGTIYNDRMGRTLDLSDVSVDGKQLSFSYEAGGNGRSFTVQVSATLNGETMEGTMSVGDFGSFPFKATRTGDPD